MSNPNYDNDNNSPRQRELDIVWIVRYLVDKWRQMSMVVGAVSVLSVIVFFCKDKVFTTSAVILTMEENSAMSGSLGSLAAMAGVKMNNFVNAKVTPDMYPSLIKCTNTLMKLAQVPVEWDEQDEKQSVYEHIKADTIKDFADYVVMYTIGLPNTIRYWNGLPPLPVLEASEDDLRDKRFDPVTIDREMVESIKWLDERIDAITDDDLGTVEIQVNGETPLQCAQLASALLAEVQEVVTEVNVSVYRKSLEKFEDRLAEIQEKYAQDRKAYFDYMDSHRDFIAERTDIRSKVLEDEYNMSSNLMISVQAEMEKIKIKMATTQAAFTVLEPIVVPIKKSAPKLLLHGIAGVILGIMGYVGFILCQLGFWQVFMPKKFDEVYAKYYVPDGQ